MSRTRSTTAARSAASASPRGEDASTAGSSPRERLLQAANELFYAEGIHTVGIDRVIEKAGVAKASLYATYGSKDELVRAYLELRAQARQFRIEKRLATVDSPRDKLLAVFDVLHDVARDPQFRGCAFVNASAEGSHDGVHVVSSAMRAWTRELFTSLARQLGVRDPVRLGRAVHLLYDGAVIGASMDRNPAIALAARDAAAVLIDGAAR
jgi:AcrR family transcriptional regulator